MKRLFLLLVACGGSAVRPQPVPPAPIEATPAVVTATNEASLEPLLYLDGSLATIATKYVDPGRFDFRKMLAGALDAMEEEVAEVITDTTNDVVTVRVVDKEKTFAGDVDSLSELGIRLTEILTFVQQHANPGTDRKEIELTAVNGMLRKLDPHTHIISAKEMEEWNVNLSGKFGGIGIVMGMRSDRIAIVEVTANGPAERAGIKTGDVIAAINGHSTEALTIDDAVSRLRGDPGTQVKLSLERSGQKLDFPITRAEIKLPVVESHMLDGNVGYVVMRHFNAETAAALRTAMEALRDKGARAWVIDLRENPGGLLAQAVRSADLFVETGTIVATVAGGKKHDIKNATPGGIDTKSPVVLLISPDTASSAEILAGALKQLDRAVLVGQTTFGKGSVQILDDAARGGKLKITTAEYIAAHDISIQGVGIAPDIELVPAVVPKKLAGESDVVRLVPEKPFREIDLHSHLTTAQTIDRDKPLATVQYLRVDPANDPQKDFEVRFARDLALATKAKTRGEFLRDVPKFVAKARKDADKEIADALKAIDIDWQPGKGTPKLAAKIDSTVTAKTGEVVTLAGEITNTGSGTAFRVHARAVSDDPSLDGVELVFGKIAPRATKRATAFVKLPKGQASRSTAIRWHITDALAPTTQLAVAGTPYPAFAFTAQLADDNDGVARKGEHLRLRVNVTNRGVTRSAKCIATLKSLVGERVLVDRGRLEVGPLEPGESKAIELAFASAEKLDTDRLMLELGVADATLGAGGAQKLEIALGTKVTDAKWEHTPPRLRIDDVPLEVTTDTVRVTGSAEDERVVGDVFITTNNLAAKPSDERKVFYATGKQPRLAFASDVPVKAGLNRIVVTARENEKTQIVRTIWVYRK